MTPTQREAALRLADYLSGDNWTIWVNAKKMEEAAVLLLELALNDPCGYDETTGNCTQNPCCFLEQIVPRPQQHTEWRRENGWAPVRNGIADDWWVSDGDELSELVGGWEWKPVTLLWLEGHGIKETP